MLAQVDQGCRADCLFHRLSSAGMNLGEGQDVLGRLQSLLRDLADEPRKFLHGF